MKGFGIVTTLALSATTLPVFGEIAAPDNLIYGSRINSSDNNIDLSDSEYTHAIVGDAAFSSLGLTNGTGDGYLQTNFDSKALNSFTMMAVCKVDLNGQSSYNTWLFGSFVSAAVGGIGIYIRSESDPDNAGKFRVVARGCITRKRVSDGVFSQVFVDTIIQNNLTTYPTSLGWLWLSIEFDLATRVWRIRNVTNGAVVANLTTDAEWVLSTFDGAQRNATPASVPNHRILYAGSDSLDNNTAMTIAEHLVWNKLLSAEELAEQIAYTKSFMANARGVVMVTP